MKHLVISCSLSPDSRSRPLAQLALERLRSRSAEVDFLDLAKVQLPQCDGGASYGAAAVREVTPRITEAAGLIVATPVYNYDVNSAAKNLLELTGSAWRGKVVGFICAAGGHSSYMSVMSFANSLMLDFRCLIVPRFVYAPEVEADDAEFGDEALRTRVDELAAEMLRLTTALSRDNGAR
jgi:FMN reductase